MTIPILLSEAVRLELRNILKSLKVGMKVKLKDGESGLITFVCDDYITVSTNRWEDENSMHGYRETKVLVYPHEWDDMYIEAEHFYNHKNYKGVIREHPGNEDLPTDITGIKNENPE